MLPDAALIYAASGPKSDPVQLLHKIQCTEENFSFTVMRKYSSTASTTKYFSPVNVRKCLFTFEICDSIGPQISQWKGFLNSVC